MVTWGPCVYALFCLCVCLCVGLSVSVRFYPWESEATVLCRNLNVSQSKIEKEKLETSRGNVEGGRVGSKKWDPNRSAGRLVHPQESLPSFPPR
mmetsp:Transcript_12911/g.25228  ORF Transcript_12911/g.25228 Transcript_12911/m.25228 type:complete len:94 (+) Transcript_12911:1034-1315(+)